MNTGSPDLKARALTLATVPHCLYLYIKGQGVPYRGRPQSVYPPFLLLGQKTLISDKLARVAMLLTLVHALLVQPILFVTEP